MSTPKPPPLTELEREISSRPYREVTVATMVLGIVSGVVLTASMTYAGLVIGFVVPASAIAAILGWGLLRGIMRRGSVVENNINQTVASAINNTSAGVIFTYPALFLMTDVEFNSVAIALAAIAGAFLGTLFIIPLRKQMIELERLRFPQGIAVAEVLRSSGAGLRKSMLLIVSTLLALGIGLTISFLVESAVWDSDKLVIGDKVGLPAYVPVTIAISLLSVGAGYITGRPGLVVLVGGVLANWVIGPLVVEIGWVSAPPDLPPEKAEAALAGMLAGSVNRPLGIGFLIGGALAGVAVAVPMMRAAFASLRGSGGGAGDELSVKWMYYGVAGAIVLLGISAYIEDPDIGIVRLLATAVVGTLWMWLAGVIVAQCAGMTGWSPVSGMALLAVAVVLLMTQGAIAISVLIGAAVCVGISQGADMMADLKTGHLVGSRPRAQQVTQLIVSWIGPGVAVVIVYLIWTTVGFGPDKSIPAPQAVTLQNVIAAVQGGNVPVDKYVVGGLISGGLTFAVGGGVGVLVGLSMYLPIFYILPYGIGCLLAMYTDRTLGRSWTVDTGIPIAAGLLVGDSLAGVCFSIYKLVANL